MAHLKMLQGRMESLLYSLAHIYNEWAMLGTALESYTDNITVVKHYNLMMCKQQTAVYITIDYPETCPSD